MRGGTSKGILAKNALAACQPCRSGVRALYWRHFAEGSLMPYLAMKLVLAGDAFSAAEVLMGFLLEAVVGRLTTADEYPNLHGLLARIQARPAYQQALQRGEWSATQHARHWAGLKY